MRCLRDAEVNDLERTFSPVYGTTNSACEQTERDFTPQRLKWRLQCRGQLDMDVAGEFVFERRDRYTATVVASSSMLGKLMQEDAHADRGGAGGGVQVKAAGLQSRKLQPRQVAVGDDLAGGLAGRRAAGRFERHRERRAASRPVAAGSAAR